MAVRVSQVRAIASKLQEEFIQANKRAKDHYRQSEEWQKLKEKLVLQRPELTRLVEAYKYLQDSPNYIESISVRDVNENTSYYRYRHLINIDRNDENVADIIDNAAWKLVVLQLPYSTEDVTTIYNKLEYETITSSNLMEIEEKVKRFFHVGFDVTIK
jgi:hypothetical protein